MAMKIQESARAILTDIEFDLDEKMPLGIYISWGTNGYLDFGPVSSFRFHPDVTTISINPGRKSVDEKV
jgi:hypothetical protein